mmetsp:Transcript_41104/g.41987  ORF Transcript_41104/g.41987 Transcript_41104/m.41987 type:complete len:418 (+) Transcript_41104:94-1347(+)
METKLKKVLQSVRSSRKKESKLPASSVRSNKEAEVSIEVEDNDILKQRDKDKIVCRICCIEICVKNRQNCRECKGIYCESCFVCKKISPRDIQQYRICRGCVKGESPGESVRIIVRRELMAWLLSNKLSSNNNSQILANLENGSTSIGKSNRSTTGSLVCPTTLLRGALSRMKGKKGTADATFRTVPSTGYFEITNKSTEMCAIKVLSSSSLACDSDMHALIYESVFPRYFTVPPEASVHLVLDIGEPSVSVFVLYSNSYSVPLDREVLYNTTTTSRQDISPCAAVTNFSQFAIYNINCSNNIYLKYRGDGMLVRCDANNSNTRLNMSDVWYFMGQVGVVNPFTCAVCEDELVQLVFRSSRPIPPKLPEDVWTPCVSDGEIREAVSSFVNPIKDKASSIFTGNQSMSEKRYSQSHYV